MTPPMVDWTDAEREAVINAMYGNGRVVPHSPADILDALAPFVADRERQAAARVLYHASNVAKRRESGDVSWLTLRAMAYDTRRGELQVYRRTTRGDRLTPAMAQAVQGEL